MSSVDRFEIRYKNTVIGTTSFELGDPPMGVAFGKFTPTSAYRRDDIAENSQLSAWAAGRQIPSEGLGIEGTVQSGEIEVTILGIPYPLYEELFPDHVEAYNTLLNAKRTDLAKSAL
jgi:hypothetical protein